MATFRTIKSGKLFAFGVLADYSNIDFDYLTKVASHTKPQTFILLSPGEAYWFCFPFTHL